MDSLPTGSDELVYIQTEKVSVTIKGKAAHPSFQGIEYTEQDSEIKVYCEDPFDFDLKGVPGSGTEYAGSTLYSGTYTTIPIFYEQQRYELVIEAEGENQIAFWHDNLNIRNKVTKVGRSSKILSGVINFGNEIGLSDLVIQADGSNYLRIVIEVFPSKISYKDDYKAIVEDVTREVYNVVFDFLRKTYLDYQQSEKVSSSPVEFFAVIRNIYRDFLRATDLILAQPHHILETTHEVLPAHKVRRMDGRSLRWIEKHPDHARISGQQIFVDRTLAIKKQSLNRRSNASFLADVGDHETSAGMSLVFSMAPGYWDLYKYYLMLLRGLAVTGDVFNISVKDLALLYEYWCFIKLNSLMKERYELISQDIIKVRGNGLCVSLVKGRGSRVKYRNPDNGETITLSYNPKVAEIPTGTQRPDNVLSLTKKGADINYEYVFDAKYRINPALPGTDYYNSISHKPGPAIGDINTMHRYRDAIVYQNGAAPFERTMFGAYVLFPYSNESEYRQHRFYESIDKVNIGGLPFLPSATSLVTDMLDALISDSSESAFERATLPRGIEEKLAKVDWNTRDVLVGSLRNKTQLDICLKHNFYHVSVSKVPDQCMPIRYIAIYQSQKLFGVDCGIRYYGEVTRCIPARRRDITEIPRDSDEQYYRFEVKEWKTLLKPIGVREVPVVHIFTNLFLLEHSTETPELKIRSEEEYRLYSELKRALNHLEINDDSKEIGFIFKDSMIVFEDGKINAYREHRIVSSYDVDAFRRKPGAVFRLLHEEMNQVREGNQ